LTKIKLFGKAKINVFICLRIPKLLKINNFDYRKCFRINGFSATELIFWIKKVIQINFFMFFESGRNTNLKCKVMKVFGSLKMPTFSRAYFSVFKLIVVQEGFQLNRCSLKKYIPNLNDVRKRVTHSNIPNTVYGSCSNRKYPKAICPNNQSAPRKKKLL